MAFEAEREHMVRTQIAARGVTDARVLEAMRRVPRHLFVPDQAQASAYADQALPIGAGQTISQPYMVAVMTAALALTGSERVLEIGTGSGYQAAILAELAREVITIERYEELAVAAEARLRSLGYTNLRVIVGDGSAGLAAEAPFDAILVAAGSPRVPEPLKAQLADGGRLVVPVGSVYQQDVVLVRREGDTYVEFRGDSCMFVPLVGQHGWRE